MVLQLYIMAKCKPNQFKITIGEEKALYASTLSSLGGDMLKLDIPMGEYELYPFIQGYYLGVKDYLPKNEDAVQVFNNRDGHKGFLGTYFDGDTDNVHRVRIFNRYIGEHLSEEWWKYNYENEMEEYEMYGSETDESETDETQMDESFYEYKRCKVTCLKCYNNIPVLFYLTKQINVDDLSRIKLQCATVINDCGNIDVCWYVVDSNEGTIGIAVKQKEFYNIMGGEAGLCLFSSNGYRAVGNFYYDYKAIIGFDDDVFSPFHTYECEFKPCNCDFENEFARRRKAFLESIRK